MTCNQCDLKSKVTVTVSINGILSDFQWVKLIYLTTLEVFHVKIYERCHVYEQMADYACADFMINVLGLWLSEFRVTSANHIGL